MKSKFGFGKSRWFGVSSALFAIVACGKSSSALAPGMTAISFQGTVPGSLAVVRSILSSGATAVTSSIAVAVKNLDGTTAGTLSLTDARVGLKEIKIKLPDTGSLSSSEQAENENIKFRGPYVVDLIQNSVTPALPAISLAAGSYRSLQLKLDKIEGDELNDSGVPVVAATDAMFGKSIYLAGTYSGDTAAGAVVDMPFSLSFELDEEFNVDAGGQDIAISATEPNPVIVAFRVVRWLMFDDLTANDKGVDFRNVTPASGAIALSDQSNGNNQKVWEVIRKAVKQSVDFGRDANDDGKLESNEDDDSDSLDTLDN